MEVKRLTARTLVSKLGSVSHSTRAEALCQLRLLSKNDDDSRPLIAQAGAIPYLAECLYSSSPSSQENAASTLLNLSISSRDLLISTPGLLDALSHLLSHHTAPSSSPEAVQASAATLHSLLLVDAYRPIIGCKRDIIYALIDIIKNSASPSRSIKDALKALFGVALYQANRSTMIDLGVVPPLFSLILVSGGTGILEDATAVVAQVAGCEESDEAFRKVSGLGVLVDLLDLETGSSMRTKENAISALLNLSLWGGESANKDIKDLGIGVVGGIIDVAEKGTEKGKTKAVALLKVVGDGCGGDVLGNSGGNSCNVVF